MKKIYKYKKSNLYQKDIAIIGIGARFPKADNINEFWHNIKNGLDCATELPETRLKDVDNYLQFTGEDLTDITFKPGAYIDEIDKFDYGFFKISPKEASLMDPNQRMFLETTWEAIEDAGYGSAKLSGTKTGVYAGFRSYKHQYADIIEKIEPSSKVISISGNTAAIIPSRISYHLNLLGPSIAIDTACSSTLVAVHLACNGIKGGECDYAIAGGVLLEILPIEKNDKIGIESSDGKTRSFDNSADGTVNGEGVVSILLKSLDKALEDGDNVYAVIKGSSVNNDGRTIGITAPSDNAQADVIISAWENAGINPETISYIEAHGTATKLGDPIEILGIRKAFEKYTNKKQFCAIGSVKSNIGHLNNVAGIAGLIKAVLALRNKQIPPTINFNRPNRKISFYKSPVYINDYLAEWQTNGEARRCGVSSFGLSGTNCHIVLEEAPKLISTKYIKSENESHILVLSANNEASLKLLIHKFKSHIEKTNDDIIDICYTANTGRGSYKNRVAILANDMEDLRLKLNSIDGINLKEMKLSDIYFKEVKTHKKNKNTIDIDENIPLQSYNITALVKSLIGQYVKEQNKESLIEICELYVNGAEIQWEDFYKGKATKRVSLPTYPFQRERCWIEIPNAVQIEGSKGFYISEWEKEEIVESHKVKNFQRHNIVLVFKDQKGIGDKIIQRLKSEGSEVIEVEIGHNFTKSSKHKYTIKENQDNYDKLFEEISTKDFTQVIHMMSLTNKSEIHSYEEFDECLGSRIYSLFYIIRALNNNNIKRTLDIVLISEFVNSIKNEIIIPENATLFGLAKVLYWEKSDYKFRCIDIDDMTKVDSIYKEVNSYHNEFLVAYRQSERFIEVIKKNDKFETLGDELILDDGVYLVTGGLGGIGLELCKFISRKKRVRLVLVGRTQILKKSEWDIESEQQENIPLNKKIKILREIEKSGSSIEYYCCDISDFSNMKFLISELVERYGRINGILHLAGLMEGNPIDNEKEENFRELLKPKLYGTWVLDYLTKGMEIDFFVMFSSAITLIGGRALGAYTASNCYLDSFAAYRHNQGKKTLTLNWSAWSKTGFSERINIDESKEIFEALNPAEAVVLFDKALKSKACRLIPGQMNTSSKIFVLGDYLPFKFSKEIQSEIIKNSLDLRKGNIEEKKLIKNVVLKGRSNNDYSELERNIADIWANVLGYKELSVDDNFFELGGDSILATRVVNFIEICLKLNISVVEIFKHLTIQALSDYLEKMLVQNNVSEVDKKTEIVFEVEEKQYYCMSSSQKRLFVLNRIEEWGTSYNLPTVMVVEGRFEKQKLCEVFQKLIDRHDSFRTAFVFIDGEPMQYIHKKIKFEVDYFDIDDESEVDSLVCGYIKPFDLSKAPLLRVGLIKISNYKSIFIIDMHHIISDGISTAILFKEFIKLYNDEKLNQQIMQYKNFSEWQNRSLESASIKKQGQYWINTFSGGIPVLNLPTDFLRPAKQSYKGERIVVKLKKDFSLEIKRMALELNATLFMTLFAVYTVLLSKYTSKEDIVVGTPIEGRKHAQFENIIGIFINTLAIRNFPNGNCTFRVYLEKVKESILNAFDNREFPFEELVNKLNLQRDLSRNPLFDVMFIMQNTGIPEIKIGGLKISNYDAGTKASKFDITLETSEKNGEIFFSFEYCTDLFSKETIERMAGHFVNIIESVVADPDIKLSEIPLVTEPEKKQILTDFNNTRTEYTKEKTLNQLFEDQVKRVPNNIALVFHNETLTYNELNSRTNQLARVLREKGVNRDSVVGIMVDRSLEMIVGMIAILKSGGAYLPIDTGYPWERIKYMLEDSNACILLTQKDFSKEIIFKGQIIDITKELYQDDDSNFESINTSSDLAYVIYTSGSTGKPKGVMIEHKSVVNLISTVPKVIEFSPESTILALTTMSFDIFVLETLLPLSLGLKVVIADESAQKSPKLLNEIIIKNNISILQATPSRIKMLLNDEGSMKCIKALKTIMIGGEALPGELLNEIKKITSARVYNMYGPTETTVWSTIKDLTEETSINIGKPIGNTRIYIVDQYNNLVPIGVIGELCIAGDGLSRGYFKRQDLTDEKFIHVPFDIGERMYKTGDLAKWLPNGDIEFVGRMDNQVKIRGFRIELGEIESILEKHESVCETIVIELGEVSEDKFLCAYVVAKKELDITDIKDFLSKLLPYYMIPLYFIMIDTIPLTPNGKIDRKSLPMPDGRMMVGTEYLAPRNKVEEMLVDIWKSVLGDQIIGINDDFFELGGNSLSVIKLEAVMEKYELHFKSVDVFTYKTIKKMAESINKEYIRKDFLERKELIVTSGHLNDSGVQLISKDQLESNYVIENIEPFNDVYYKSCFYNSLFSIIKHFGKNELTLLVNDTLVYENSSENGSIKIGTAYISDLPIEKVIEKLGIIMNAKIASDNIITDIINSLKNLKPVIIWVDCFYESIRLDTYKKKHMPHTILIYGFDESQRILNIIEHKHMDNLSYEKLSISYEDIINSYNGYLHVFQQRDNKPSYFEFSTDLTNTENICVDTMDINQSYISLFSNNLCKYYNERLMGLECLKEFIGDFKQLVCDEDKLRGNIDELVNIFNDIINCIRVEKYKVSKLFGIDHPDVVILESIINDWCKVRAAAVKFSYSSIFRKDKLLSAINVLYRIYDNEQRNVLNFSN